MKMTFKLSDVEVVETITKEDGTVSATHMTQVNNGLWYYTWRDFSCLEDAITYYQIKF